MKAVESSTFVIGADGKRGISLSRGGEIVLVHRNPGTHLAGHLEFKDAEYFVELLDGRKSKISQGYYETVLRRLEQGDEAVIGDVYGCFRDKKTGLHSAEIIVEIYCHRIELRFWDAKHELTEEVLESIEEQAVEHVKECLENGVSSGELNSLWDDKEIRGAWEILRE